MTDRIQNGIAALLTPPPSTGVQFSQARILTWDPDSTGFMRNTLEWRGITLTDVPLIEGINAVVLKPGDIVGMLGWAPENAKGVGSWWILGKLSNPGEFVGDINITARIFWFRTVDGNPLAFFGRGASGEPLIALYYGGSDGTRALQVQRGNSLSLHDTSGNTIFANDAESVGIARPYFNIPMYPSSGTSVGTGGPFWPQFTNTVYQEVMHGITTLWHPRIRIGVATNTSSGTVEWQIRQDGTVLGSNSGTGLLTVDVDGWGDTTNPGSQRSIQLWCRNTSGAASRVITDYCYGLQSLWSPPLTSPTSSPDRILRGSGAPQ